MCTLAAGATNWNRNVYRWGASGEQRLATFALSLAEKSKENKELSTRSIALADRLKDPIKFGYP
jgi:hypothetical protein